MPESEIRTPTETLVKCLEEFGNSEPKKTIVIWTNVDNDLCWSGSGEFHYCEVIGMLECVKGKVMEKFLR